MYIRLDSAETVFTRVIVVRSATDRLMAQIVSLYSLYPSYGILY
jgi:hypothetical protein